MYSEEKKIIFFFSGIIILLMLLFFLSPFTNIVQYDFNNKQNYLLYKYIVFFINTFILLLLYFSFSVIRNQVRTSKKEISEKEKQLLIDDMTQVHNKIGFYKLGDIILKRAIKYKNNIAVMVIDIDKFKHFNDTYGHIIGDKVIIRVASILKKSLREDKDLIGRFGGDEFLILLANIEKENLEKLINRIQEKISKIRIKDVNEKITLSIGIVYIEKVNENNKLEELINWGDISLYKVKAKGGNGYSFYE
jgi:diguanylate cyclase (GGDEF)-like protein